MKLTRFFSPLSLCLALSVLWLTSLTGWASGSTTLVISQVYGGGGNSGATLENDFVELHNISGSSVSLTGFSVQYSSATNTGAWTGLTSLSGTIPSGGYFLVQEAAGSAGTASLPMPDATGSINMSATAGKVALVSSTTVLSGAISSGSGIVDMVGFGTTANAYEGSGPTPAPSNTTSLLRNNQGSTDTNNNATDFTVSSGTIVPRNSATTPYLPTPVASQVQVETAPDGSGSVEGSPTISLGTSVTVYAISRSSNNTFVANVAGTWSLTSVTGGVVSGDLVPSTDGKSAVFTPHATGSAVISVSSGGLTSGSSGTITVNPAPSNPMGVGASSQTKIPANQSTLLSVTVSPATNPASTGITVTADLSAFGLSTTTPLYDNGTNGDVTAGDGIYSLTLPVGIDQPGGSYTVPVTIIDAEGRSSTTSITFTVLGSFTIFHTNDTHARITPHKWIVPAHGDQVDVFQEVGGAAYMTAELLSLTGANPNSLVLDGGDISEGNPIGDYNNGPDVTVPGNDGAVGFFQLLSQKLKALPVGSTTRGRGIDAWVVGNHDVRYANYIANLKNQTDFPVISVNVCQHNTTTPYFQPYVIVTVNGTKIGIIGYTTESSVVGPDLASTIDIVPCDWDGTEAGGSSKVHLATYVNTLRNTQGCDVVILLTHDGHANLSTVTGSGSSATSPVLVDTSAAKLPEIAITGHWHTWCESVWEPSVLNYKTIFMESSSFIKYVGELKVTGAGKYISCVQHPLIDSQITPDPDVTNYVNTEKSNFNAAVATAVANGNKDFYPADQILGYTNDDLVLDKKMKWWSADEYPWTGDNTADGYICDGLKWKAAQMFGSCDLSIEVGGGVRSDIAAGPMTFTNIYEMYPWNDDLLWMVKMTGQEIWNFIQNNSCDVGVSREWHVTATDGKITSLTYNGNPVNLTATYNVSISNYIYQNNTFIDQSPTESTYLCRTALMDYAQTFPSSGSAYSVGGSRYTLNTDFAGGYYCVVTMMNDADTSTTFDDGFIRMLSATPETLGRLGSIQVPTSLVNSDGSVNRANRLSEIEWYRSYLGFKTGALKNGDIVQIYGKGGFYNGDPEFVDSEGIIADGVEFNVVGHDATLSQPEYYSSINAFYNDTYKNHYVKFFGKKTGANTVVDSQGTTLTVMDSTGYSAKALPGNVNDLLQLTGVATDEYYALRFRCDTAVEASTVGVMGFPPSSQISTIPTGTQTGPIQLTATASGAPVSNVNTTTLTPLADAEVASGKPTSNYGTSTDIYMQSSASDSYGNESGWLKFDLSSFPAGSITGARLVMYNWKSGSADMPVTAYSAIANTANPDPNSWTESGLNWNNQPGIGNALSSVTLSASSTDVSYSWDVTSAAQAGSSASDKLVSLLLAPTTESTSATLTFAFDSKEYGSNSPVLQVDTPNNAVAPTIASVQFFYRYSVDGTTYGAWTAFQTVTTAPYSVTFNYPSGAGYYEFYSEATDSSGNVEPAPAFYDTSATYNVAASGGTGSVSDTPTMPQWGLLLLGTLLAGYAASQLRTRLHLFLFILIVGVGILFLLSSRVNAHSNAPQARSFLHR